MPQGFGALATMVFFMPTANSHSATALENPPPLHLQYQAVPAQGARSAQNRAFLDAIRANIGRMEPCSGTRIGRIDCLGK
jgi:hypothetical protein